MARATALVIGHIYKCRMFYYAVTQEAVNTIYFEVNTVIGGTEGDLADTWTTSWGVPVRTCIANTATYLGVDIQDVTGAPPYETQAASILEQGIGSGGAVQLPGQVSGVLKMTTALTGRAYRGRLYIPFPPTAMVSVGPPPVPSGAYNTILNALGDLMVGSFAILAGGSGGVTGNANVILKHRKNKANVTPPPTNVINAIATGQWGTQRRRGDYGRQNSQPVP